MLAGSWQASSSELRDLTVRFGWAGRDVGFDLVEQSSASLSVVSPLSSAGLDAQPFLLDPGNLVAFGVVYDGRAHLPVMLEPASSIAIFPYSSMAFLRSESVLPSMT